MALPLSDIQNSHPINATNQITGVETPNETVEPFHDGGTRAWLQVFGSFLVFTNLWGFIFAFGSFQSYYQLTYFPNESPSTISWIGTTSNFLQVVVGVVSGPLFDLGYFKTIFIVGAIIETLGVFLMSICTTYWQVFVTQGIMVGLGNGLLSLPSLALVGRSFKRHRAVAFGITTCGAPIGGILYTLVFEQLISRLGWGWMVRVMGFIMLGSYTAAFPLLLWSAKNVGDISRASRRRKLLDVSALRDLPFWSYTLSNFLIFFGYMNPFTFMPSYGETQLGMGRSLSLYVNMIAQASSVFGRLLAAYLATKVGVMIPWVTSGFSSGVFCIAWIDIHSTASFIAFAALYRFFSGSLVPLPPSFFTTVCPDRTVLGTRMGMSQAITSLASLTGSPLAAALSAVKTRNAKSSYLGLQLFSGLTMVVGGINLVVLWIMLIKKRGLKKLI